MRRYDAEAIARYYRVRPWRTLWRAVSVVWLFAGFVLGLKQDDWFNRTEAKKLKRAAQLRKILTRLGPTYIKVGQALSTRPDLVRKDFLEELVKLQDQLPPFPSDIAFAIVERELDHAIDEIFSQITPQPIAAASLGQVYQARLHTGEEVAVKVQRPHLLPVLTLDLYLMRWAAHWISPWLPLNLGHDLILVVDEFGTKLFEEVDYQNEGQNAEKFAANFLGDPTVKVPAIYWKYSSQHVLTLEWIHGSKLTDLQKIRDSNLDRDTLIEIGVTAGLRQLLEFGFFHADPHPGNLFATPDGRMAYIDFGMMDQLHQEAKETLVDSVVHLINQDYEHLAQDFVKLGFLTPGTDIRPIIPALEEVLGNALGESVQDFNFKTITDKFSSLMYEYPFRLPAKFALIIRSVVTQEGLALSLNPDFKIVDVAFPYVARRLLTGESAALRRRLIEVLFKDGKFQWERMENLIAIARSDTHFDLLPTAQLGLQYLLSDEGNLLRRQIILALIEDDRLHTAEVQRLWDLIKDDVKPARLLNAAIGALTEFSAERAATLLPLNFMSSKSLS
ncbi:MAG: AarF/ABC1/UbiB kinase family protein [Drouetiella hepatica Uher 2000/2452]|jgi:predicted unusual protein kinase regulating ubiquinone biosynthesis (AarF/ABC1/UbiB family)|uniref:AarF/ABC1/UbiB kinase family protein n=1 Tax=Drouetiella hepatica Uher 2000/2452 TaxID=904376 RepID=A0A951QBC2_9CYAN|nr:AarF/ABC1/UbiB kinase family protein [Drouetiella hepatica Uher 2000/2452]